MGLFSDVISVNTEKFQKAIEAYCKDALVVRSGSISRHVSGMGISVDSIGLADFFLKIGVHENNNGILTPSVNVNQQSLDSVYVSTSKLCYEHLISTGFIKEEQLKFDVEEHVFYFDESDIQCEAVMHIAYLCSITGCYIERQRFVIIPTLLPLSIKENVRKKTLEELKNDLSHQEEIGEAGEKFVLQYEKRRLPLKAMEIRQISHENVSAGYDIVSFQTEDSLFPNRFIEVKTFVGEPQFVWSLNEFNVAKKKGNLYFIYLVDFNKISDKDYVPTIIQNPSQTLAHEWKMEPISFMCTPNI